MIDEGWIHAYMHTYTHRKVIDGKHTHFLLSGKQLDWKEVESWVTSEGGWCWYFLTAQRLFPFFLFFPHQWILSVVGVINCFS